MLPCFHAPSCFTPFCCRRSGMSQLPALSKNASKHFSVDNMLQSNIAAIVTAAIPLSQTAADERSGRLKGQRTSPARRCRGTCPQTLSPGSPSSPGCPEPLPSSYSSSLQPENTLVRHSLIHPKQLSSGPKPRTCFTSWLSQASAVQQLLQYIFIGGMHPAVQLEQNTCVVRLRHKLFPHLL